MQVILAEQAYDRQRAVDYAHKWAFGRNPAFYDFSKIGGDCTNFASQCLYAGCGVMNFTETYGWYYLNLNNRAPAWTSVVYLYDFLTRNQSVGPFAEVVPMERVEPGDLVQLKLEKDRFQHTPVVVSVGAKPNLSNILVAAHSDDADNRPLSTYPITDIRFLHILGARVLWGVTCPACPGMPDLPPGLPPMPPHTPMPI